MPQDPIADWLARSSTAPRAPRLSSESALEGTIFDDPVRDFLLTSPVPHSPRASQIERVVDRIFTAPKPLTDFAAENARWLTEPTLDDSPARAAAKGFTAGIGEAGAAMASPYNIASALYPEAKISGALGKLLKMVTRGGYAGARPAAQVAVGALQGLSRAVPMTGDAFLAGQSAAQTKDAIERGDTTDALEGAAMTAAGALGAASRIHGLQDDIARTNRQAAWNRWIDRKMTPTAEDWAPGSWTTYYPAEPVPPRSTVSVSPVDPNQFKPSVELPPHTPPGLPPGDDPLAFLTDGGGPPRGLPPAGGGGGPFAPEAPRGGIAAVPPYGKDVTWQHPAAPSADPVADFLLGAPAAPPAAAPTVEGQPPAPAPAARPGKAGPSENDIIAKRLGYRNEADMRQQQPALADKVFSAAAQPVAAGAPPAPTPAPPALNGLNPQPAPPPAPPAAAAPAPRTGAPQQPLLNGVAGDVVQRALTTPGTDPALATRAGLPLPPETPETALETTPPVTPDSPVTLDHEGESLWQEALADARAQGYDGPEEALRQKFIQHLASGDGLIDDLQGIVEHEDPGARALLHEIAKRGGIALDKDDPYHGELSWLWDHTDSGQANMTTKNGRAYTRRLPTADLAGVRNVLRQKGSGGIPLDGMAEHLRQDPRWRDSLQGPNDVLQAIKESVERYRNGAGDMVPTRQQALHGAGVRLGEPWWHEDTDFDPATLEREGVGLQPIEPEPGSMVHEVTLHDPEEAATLADKMRAAGIDVEVRAEGDRHSLFIPEDQRKASDAFFAREYGDGKPADPLADLLDTGEAQNRLPGDVGAVRDAEVPTPREDAPFSLSGGVSDINAPKQDWLSQIIGGETTPADVAREKVWGFLNDATARGESVGRLANALQNADKWRLDPSIENDLLELFRKADVQAPTETPDGFSDWLTELARTPDPSPSNGETPATAAQPPAPAVRANIKDFLVKQLGYAPEDVDALGPEEAMRIGNQVRMHEGGVRAGIEQYRKPAPPAKPSDPSPRPNLGEDSPRVPADELATLLGIQERRTALAKTRLPADAVDEPIGEKPAGAPKPRTAAERHAAGEKLTAKERAELGLPEEKPPARTQSQSEIALAKSKMTEDARTRAKLLENPTPENLDEYTRLLGEAADRQAEREFKGGGGKEGKLRTNERTGEYLASGLGGLQKLYDENPRLFWFAMRTAGGALIGAMVDEDDPIAGMLTGAAAGAALGPISRALRANAPGVFKALKETLPPSIGGKEGLAPGKQPVRAPRDLSKDISGLEQRVYGQPHRTVPDVWTKISPVLEDLAAAEREQPSTTPTLFQFTRNMYLKEALGEIDAAARDSKTNGLHRRAKYLEAMADELRGTPTVLERMVSDITSGKVSPKQTRQTLHRIEGSVYLSLLGAAIDTAVTNRTQILLAYPQIGAKGLLEGVKAARTPEGQDATKFLNLDKPGDAPTGPLAKVPNRTLRKLADLVMSPLKSSDQRNRKEVYLGAMMTARKQGLSPQEAHEFAMEVTAQTQGTPGELGNNPFHRHLGPLRMFTKYPQIWGQWLADAAAHPDPGVRRRLVGYFLGFAAVQAVTGINTMNLMFPRLIPSSAAYSATKDVVSHIPGLNVLTGPADHTMAEDIDPRRGGKLMRYPAKLTKELGDFARDGFGEHTERAPDGQARGTHSAMDGFLSLLGLESTSHSDQRAATNEAYDWIAENARKRGIQSRLSREDLARAIEGGDTDAQAAAAAKLSPAQLRSFYQQRQRDVYQRMRARVPTADRAEFDRKFKGPLGGK